MDNSFSFQQISKAGNPDSNCISRQNKLNLMANFIRIKYEYPKSKQSQLANQLGYSTSTLQRYRSDINMVSPYRINPNNNNKLVKKASNTNFDNNSHRKHYLITPQMTSNDLKITQTNTKSNGRNKNVLKAGSMQENIEINDQYLDETLNDNDI